MVSSQSGIDGGLKALSDGTRRGILGLLKDRQLSVLEIAEEFPMSRPAISKHLRILKEAGLVLETPAGRQRLYTLETAPLELLVVWLAEFNGGRPRGMPSQGRGLDSRVGEHRRFPIRPRDTTHAWRVW